VTALAAIAWIASSDLTAAQSRLFSCPHARVVELTVNGPNSVSANPIERIAVLGLRPATTSPEEFAGIQRHAWWTPEGVGLCAFAVKVRPLHAFGPPW
jgi:hypothetical protein